MCNVVYLPKPKRQCKSTCTIVDIINQLLTNTNEYLILIAPKFKMLANIKQYVANQILVSYDYHENTDAFNHRVKYISIDTEFDIDKLRGYRCGYMFITDSEWYSPKIIDLLYNVGTLQSKNLIIEKFENIENELFND